MGDLSKAAEDVSDILFSIRDVIPLIFFREMTAHSAEYDWERANINMQLCLDRKGESEKEWEEGGRLRWCLGMIYRGFEHVGTTRWTYRTMQCRGFFRNLRELTSGLFGKFGDQWLGPKWSEVREAAEAKEVTKGNAILVEGEADIDSDEEVVRGRHYRDTETLWKSVPSLASRRMPAWIASPRQSPPSTRKRKFVFGW